MMNKKLLSMAVVAAIGTAGVGGAQAVYVNNDGLGEVLIYPFYSVEGDQDTYITVVNTTDQVKAVKVRFLEGMNSQEVLDFNLYLSPRDHWSARVSEGSDGGARLVTSDQSCTVPNIVDRAGSSVGFRPFQYSEDSVNGIERTREGYVELIEMGTVINLAPGDPDGFNPARWATHDSTGVPRDCAALVDAWRPGGEWDAAPNEAIRDASGGLYGYGNLINPADGVSVGYDAVAFDDFWDDPRFQHSEPGSLFPSLGSGSDYAQVIDGNDLFDLDFDSGIDALSATIMKGSIANDFVLAPEINAATDWVVNFPTKRFYTNTAFLANGAPAVGATPPFTAHWDRRVSRACEAIGLAYWDREEQKIEGDVDFSPRPTTDPASLCAEVNVVSFNNESPLYASDRIRGDVGVEFDNGWLEMSFDNIAARTLTDETGDVEFRGLPVVGFAVQRYTNGDLGGLLANYMSLVNHKGVRNITVEDVGS